MRSDAHREGVNGENVNGEQDIQGIPFTVYR